MLAHRMDVSPPSPPSPAGLPPLPGERPARRAYAQWRGFWRQVTDGLEIDQLWSQFIADARSGYRLYSREVDRTHPAHWTRRQRLVHVLKQFFWTILMKLSPARRVVLLVALVLLVLPNITFRSGDFELTGTQLRFLGSLLVLLLLLLEVADRVTMKRDLEIAREIQLWLVPGAPPSLPGLDVSFVNRPANTVAGDYYDVFPLDAELTGTPAEGDGPAGVFRPGGAGQGARRVLLVVADVAGKSLPAALLMATFQASLRSLCAAFRSLPELLAGLNSYACVHSRGGRRFTTAFLAECDLVTGELAYVNAGHNPPLLQRCSGTMEKLETGGPPVGIRPDSAYNCGLLRLEAGDCLIVYTDGLVEAENGRGEEYGEARLAGMVAASGGLAAAQLLDRLMGDVQSFVGNTAQRDDITCLVARRT